MIYRDNFGNFLDDYSVIPVVGSDTQNYIFRGLVSLHSTDLNRIGINVTNSALLDEEFEYLFSDRKISPLIERIFEKKSEDGKFSSACWQKLNDMIYLNYFPNWEYIYKSMNANYNPIENYSMTETESARLTKDGTLSDTENENNYFAFNSKDSSGADKSSPVSENSSSTTIDSEDNSNRTLTRSGNIGVTTSQQMIESEIELRKKTFQEIVFRNIADFILLEV